VPTSTGNMPATHVPKLRGKRAIRSKRALCKILSVRLRGRWLVADRFIAFILISLLRFSLTFNYFRLDLIPMHTYICSLCMYKTIMSPRQHRSGRTKNIFGLYTNKVELLRVYQIQWPHIRYAGGPAYLRCSSDTRTEDQVLYFQLRKEYFAKYFLARTIICA
jgi:hypothetical protein